MPTSLCLRTLEQVQPGNGAGEHQSQPVTQLHYCTPFSSKPVYCEGSGDSEVCNGVCRAAAFHRSLCAACVVVILV